MFRNSFRLGKIFGIEMRLDYSWFIIFTLITWTLAAQYFPHRYPDWPIMTHWVIGLVTSLLFFASVLAHEIAHSLVARSTGVPVHSITLFIFGGVAQISREPKRPRDEFFMALAGPAASIATGILFGILWLATSNVSEPVAAVGMWLGGINIILAIFNLIPGFPLDGGRVLRSIIWGITNNLKKATRAASTVGRGVAYIFIFFGIWNIFRGYWINGLWYAFIGWFLENAAANSYRQVALRDSLQGHTAREVMITDCPHVSRNLSLEQLVHDYILYTSRRCFPVVDEESVRGIVTLHDVKKVSQERWSNTTAGEVMTPLEQLKAVNPDDELFEVLEQMTTGDVNQMPVIENGKLIGMVARDNVLAFIHTRAELGV